MFGNMKKNLKQISRSDINNNKINYLYLFSLDKFGDLNENKKIIQKENTDKNIEACLNEFNNNIFSGEELKKSNLIQESKGDISENNQMKESKNIIDLEELRVKFKDFEEEEIISKLKKEETNP